MTPDDAARLLGLAVGASRDEVKAAFRAKARSAHPDAGGDKDAFIRLTRARDILLLAPPAPTITYVPAAAIPRRRSWRLFATWVGLLVLGLAVNISGSDLHLTVAEPIIRSILVIVGFVGYALTGRQLWLVLGIIGVGATAIVALLFTTLGALIGLLFMIAPMYGLLLMGQASAKAARIVRPGTA